jgi:hypothetical protein
MVYFFCWKFYPVEIWVLNGMSLEVLHQVPRFVLSFHWFQRARSRVPVDGRKRRRKGVSTLTFVRTW